MKKVISIKVWHLIVAAILGIAAFVCWDIFNINTFEDEYNAQNDGDYKSPQAWSILVERHLAKHHSSIICDWYENKYLYNDIPPFPWADIIESLVERKDSVHFINDQHCWRCGSKLLHMYFDSPRWTWKEGYGQAGPMVICPNCPRKVRFEKWIMN